MMKNLKMIVIIIVSLLVLIIVLQNTQSVETKLLFITITMPRAFLLFLTFLFGFVVGSVSIATFSRQRRQSADSNA
jgi:uncharacterized integral membrane protein